MVTFLKAKLQRKVLKKKTDRRIQENENAFSFQDKASNKRCPVAMTTKMAFSCTMIGLRFVRRGDPIKTRAQRRLMDSGGNYTRECWPGNQALLVAGSKGLWVGGRERAADFCLLRNGGRWGWHWRKTWYGSSSSLQHHLMLPGVTTNKCLSANKQTKKTGIQLF